MDLFDQITPQTTILTPNRRLSASILKKYSLWKIEHQHACWNTLDILPLYPSWLQRMWKHYAARNIQENHLLLTAHQEQVLWEKILREAPENEYLLQISDTAKLAKSAWEILKRWRVEINDPALNLTDDSRAFVLWAKKFQSLLQKNDWLDQHSMANVIATKIAEKVITPAPHIILVGFTEISPQYQHLLQICEQHHSRIDHYQPASRNQSSYFIGLNDTETEIRTMACWAKNLTNQSLSIGCIIPNLETIRESVVRIFSEVFGETKFNISAGKSLTSYPVIHDALQLLNLNKKNISISALTSLLRSPFIGEAEREKNKRALLDNKLRNSNILTVTLNQLIDPQEKHNIINACPALAKRIKNFNEKIGSLEKIQPIREWVRIFNELLSLLGWPGERSINSHEYQVIQNSWLPLLNEYSTFDLLLEPQTYTSALHYLTCLVSSTVFQPESPEAEVNILGLLEAAEIPFDYCWSMGLDDSAWPSRPKPNPFIPLRLQKSLQMPNASPERELSYCQTLTKQIQNSTTHVTFSYPLQRDDAMLRPSSLLTHYKEISLAELNLHDEVSIPEKIFLSQQIEYFQDDVALPISTLENIYGGVNIFKMQAACPFKAFAELRLHAKKIEETTVGLRKLDRGNIIHKALEYIWQDLGNSITLNMKSEIELKTLIKDCARLALAEIVDTNNINNKRYLALELQRLEKLLWNWLQIEKNRPPFSIVSLEQEISTTIGNITASFRVDRIDALIDESQETKHLIIDYKTGKDIDKNNWFGDRLDEPQLPIYCIVNPEDTIGIAFAKVNPFEMKIMGACKHPVKMNAITPISDITHADASHWTEQMRIWQMNLEKLANDFHQGKAEVDPKDKIQTCRLCALQPFCRIHETTDMNDLHDNHDTL